MRNVPPAADPESPRGSLQLAWAPVVGPFFFGKLISTLGIWVHNIAGAIVVFELTSSALLVGAVSVAQFAPQILLTPWSGARADRTDRRRQLLGGRLIATAGSAGLVIWSATVGLKGTAGALAVIATGLVVGIGWSLGGPAMQALVPTMVRPQELAAAVALNSVPPSVGRAAGPALGALLVTVGGPTLTFAVAGATHLVFALILVRLPISDSDRRRPKDGRIRAGVRYLRTDPAIAAILAGGTAVGISTDPVVTLTPAIAASFGSGSGLVGALASAFGLGAGAAFAVLGVLRRRLGLPRLATSGLLVTAAAYAALAVSPEPAFALVALVCAGAGMTCSLTSLVTLLQQRSPDELRGRIFALWSVAFLGSRPLAAAMNGALADTVSIRAALAVVVGLLVLGAWIARPSRAEPPGMPTTQW